MKDNTCRVVHCKKEPYDVYIGRPSKWGNPFSHLKKKTKAKYLVETREESIRAYRGWIMNGEGRHLLKDLGELRGKVLGCWCKPKSCHGDVLAELVAIIYNAPVGIAIDFETLKAYHTDGKEVDLNSKEE